MANSYLSKSASSGNSTTFTISAWIKRTVTGTATQIFNAHKADSIAGHTNFGIDSTDRLDFSTWSVNVLTTNRKLRDTNGWYHLVLQVDSTNSTADDRVKMWINGVQETSFSTRNNPSSSQAFSVNDSASTHTIGAGNQNSGRVQYFDGFISHFVLVDGSVVAPTAFGQTDATSGIWKFKSPSGITWGNNGFHLKFENSANLGLDSSGNSNSFATVGNLKQALDTPSNVFATLNPLATFANITLTNGNNTYTLNAGTWESTPSTLALPSSGKYYAEFKWNASSTSAQYMMVGVDSPQLFSNWSTQYPGYTSVGYAYGWDGDKRNNGSNSSYGAAWGATSIIGVAIDMDNKKLYFHKDGVYQNSGVPTSGSTGTGALSLTGDEYYLIVSGYKNTENPSIHANFGNGYFGTSSIADAGSNASNNGSFEYDVPTGYTALSTKGLNT